MADSEAKRKSFRPRRTARDAVVANKKRQKVAVPPLPRAVTTTNTVPRPGSVVIARAPNEVTPDLDSAVFTLRTIPDRIARWKRDPWHGYSETVQKLPDVSVNAERGAAFGKSPVPPLPGGRPSIVVYARKPRLR